MIRALLALVFALAATVAEARPLWLVDFVFLAEGRTLGDHDRFTEDAQIIAGRHGAKRLITLDRVPGLAHPGPIAPDRIDLWSVPDRAAFDAWTNDPDRVWYEDLAGHILDGQSSRYLAQEYAVSPVRPGRLYLVDILRFGEGMDVAAFNNYAADLARAGQRHGLRASATLGDVGHLSGPWGKPDWLHLYYVPGHEALDSLLADARYRKIEARRSGLFDTGNSARQLYEARSHFQP